MITYVGTRLNFISLAHSEVLKTAVPKQIQSMANLDHEKDARLNQFALFPLLFRRSFK